MMIERGMVEWLVEYLADWSMRFVATPESSALEQPTESSNLYGLEYSTALFMNLCLHRQIGLQPF